MISLKTLKTTASRFASDRSGNFAMVFAAASTVIMLAAGLAVDFSHMLNVKTNLSSALDAALLSTAREIARGKVSAAGAQSKVEEFLAANLNTNRVNPAMTHLASFNLNIKTHAITATAITTYKVAFPVFSVSPMQDISVKAAVAYAERAVEVSMVLDVTGSMDEKPGGVKKIDELKASAKSAVAEFIDNGSGNTRVAIIPYSFGVNAGGLKSFVVNEAGLPAKDSCATERRGANMFTDANPGNSKVTRADRINFWADDNNDGKLEIRPNGYYLDLPMDYKPYPGKYGADCPDVSVLPLTNDAKALNSTIDKLKAAGGTAGQIGLQWGWYMVSPNWKSAFGTSAEPVAYGTPNVDKFIILMTDGLFNSEASGLSGAAIPNTSGITQPSGRLAMQYCNNIKAKNVKIFTIGFRLKDIGNASEQSEATKLLTECATKPAAGETTFFDAQNGAQLTAAFKEIAKRVERVSLID
jgi:Flp pilus assembly protein TadG